MNKKKFKKIKRLLSFSLLFSIIYLYSFSQEKITGKVTSTEDNTPLVGVSVVVKGTSNGVTTDENGGFSITASNNDVLVFSFVGLETHEEKVNNRSKIDVSLNQSSISLAQLSVIGSRGENRSKIFSPSPVDIIDMTELATTTPQTTLGSILNLTAPSFNSTQQTISDGTDHIDPATLRGLSPDQVLVLVNGKRRHTTSLVNINGTVGRGSSGVDFNTIPVSSIGRIEVLRDGAAAQYGSDAISGIINVVLKRSTERRFNISATTGANFTSEIRPKDGVADGLTVDLKMDFSTPLGNKGGFLTLASDITLREHTNRMKTWSGTIFSGYNRATTIIGNRIILPVGMTVAEAKADITDVYLKEKGLTRDDFTMRVGQSELKNANLMLNLEVPITFFKFYAFGGLNTRNGRAAGFYRLPNQNRTFHLAYPNGFLPFINTELLDASFGFGFSGKLGKWDFDISNTLGRNGMDYIIDNSFNASLGYASPKTFDAGGFSFLQNTTNFDIKRNLDILQGFNIAAGFEHRFESYEIHAGEEASYKDGLRADSIFTNDGTFVSKLDSKGNTVSYLDARPGGAQVFPGFRPENELTRDRRSIGLYADLEINITKDLLVGAAARFENYSDFGNNFNWKANARYTLKEKYTVRFAVSTGFRAPSLQQKYFSSVSTQFVSGIPIEQGFFPNDSRVASVLGIPNLKQETSFNISGGFTLNPIRSLVFTIDGYMTDITDRIILTDGFKGNTIQNLLTQANAGTASFFVNGIDTRTFGIDFVGTHNADFGRGGKLRTSLSFNYSQTTQQGDVKTSTQLEPLKSTYFGRAAKNLLLEATPLYKGILALDYSFRKFNISVKNSLFGNAITTDGVKTIISDAEKKLLPSESVIVENVEGTPGSYYILQRLQAKVVTDLTIGFKATKNISIALGANNLLDIYPDKQLVITDSQGKTFKDANGDTASDFTSTGRFIYSRRAPQIGMNGRFLFVRLNITL